GGDHGRRPGRAHAAGVRAVPRRPGGAGRVPGRGGAAAADGRRAGLPRPRLGPRRARRRRAPLPGALAAADAPDAAARGGGGGGGRGGGGGAGGGGRRGRGGRGRRWAGGAVPARGGHSMTRSTGMLPRVAFE